MFHRGAVSITVDDIGCSRYALIKLSRQGVILSDRRGQRGHQGPCRYGRTYWTDEWVRKVLFAGQTPDLRHAEFRKTT